MEIIWTGPSASAVQRIGTRVSRNCCLNRSVQVQAHHRILDTTFQITLQPKGNKIKQSWRLIFRAFLWVIFELTFWFAFHMLVRLNVWLFVWFYPTSLTTWVTLKRLEAKLFFRYFFHVSVTKSYKYVIRDSKSISLQIYFLVLRMEVVINWCWCCHEKNKCDRNATSRDFIKIIWLSLFNNS